MVKTATTITFTVPASDDGVVASPEKTDVVPLATKLFAELVGTFALTLVIAGSAVVPAASRATALPAAGAVAVGLVLMALVYSIGRLSGSHVNPAVTLGVALRGAFEWKIVPLYWIAQIAGGFLAAAFLLVTFGNVAHLGSTLPSPSTSAGQAFVMEAVMTAIFVGVILAVTKEPSSQIGHNAGLAIGATLTVCALFGGAASGASLNPARSIGPALLSGATQDLWVYIAAPMLGGLIAAGVDKLLHGTKLSQLPYRAH
jgi:MIP family channel proteins